MNVSNNKGHGTETPDISYIRNVDTAHEASDGPGGGAGAGAVDRHHAGDPVHLLLLGAEPAARQPSARNERESDK